MLQGKGPIFFKPLASKNNEKVITKKIHTMSGPIAPEDGAAAGTVATTAAVAQSSTVELSYPLPEIHEPHIEDCISRPIVSVVLPGAIHEEVRQVEVMRMHNPTQAYITLPGHPPKLLNPLVPGWGEEILGSILHRESSGHLLFTHPKSPEDLERVVIKRLRKAVVHNALARGFFLGEDPYIDILRMQTIGDNTHVLSCIDALQDDTYLYVITPYCEHDLNSWIMASSRQQGSENFAKDVFTNMLQNIEYLQRHKICHRNITPGTCKFYKGRILLTGLGYSFRAPERGSLIRNIGAIVGEPSYIPPEVFVGLPYDAQVYDLWSTTVIVFNLLTGCMLYKHPVPDDMLFRYFVLANGLSRCPYNVLTREVVSGLHDTHVRTTIMNLSQKCAALSPEILQLFEGCFCIAPYKRWTIQDAKECLWLKGRAV